MPAKPALNRAEPPFEGGQGNRSARRWCGSGSRGVPDDGRDVAPAVRRAARERAACARSVRANTYAASARAWSRDAEPGLPRLEGRFRGHDWRRGRDSEARVAAAHGTWPNPADDRRRLDVAHALERPEDRLLVRRVLRKTRRRG